MAVLAFVLFVAVVVSVLVIAYLVRRNRILLGQMRSTEWCLIQAQELLSSYENEDEVPPEAEDLLWDEQDEYDDVTDDSFDDDEVEEVCLGPGRCDCLDCSRAWGRDLAIEQAERTGDWSNL